MSDNHPVLTSTKGAVLILEAAAAEGVPAPRSTHAIGHMVDLQVADPQDVQAWATWLAGPTAEVAVSPNREGTALFHEYAGDLFDQRFKVYAVTYVPAAVTA